MELCQTLNLPSEIRPISIEEFKQADEAFACTTAGGIMPIRRLDDRIYGNDAPGPVTLKIKNLFWDWHARPDLRLEVTYDD